MRYDEYRWYRHRPPIEVATITVVPSTGGEMHTDDDRNFENVESLVTGTVERLRGQGCPARDGLEGCYYRGRLDSPLAGMGCAVGVWLPDTFEVRGLNGTVDANGTWEKVVRLEPRLLSFRPTLRELQYLHDDYRPERDGAWSGYLDRWADPAWRVARTEGMER